MKKNFSLLVITLSLVCCLARTASAATSPLTFTGSETKDGGTVNVSQVPYTWTVNLPNNFIKVETAHYSKTTPDNVRKYMGWQGVLKVNNNTVWQFKSWSSQTGGINYDGTLGQDVKDSSGIGLWIDATKFFKTGANTVYFDHFNEGDIGLKIKVTAGTSSYCGDGNCDSDESCSVCPNDCGVCKNSDGVSCSTASECLGGYCVHNQCRSSSTYCGDYYCDNGENCSLCSTDCGVCKKADGESCSAASECTGGYCLNNQCGSAAFYCGDGNCNTTETCSSCSSDCGECQTCGNGECDGSETCSSCSSDCGECNFCGDGTCDNDETCSSCSSDCGVCTKSDGSSCSTNAECSNGYCVHNQCRNSLTYCGDYYCDKGENCSLCPADCGNCKKENGQNCETNECCKSGNCVENICRPQGYIWCGDGICQYTEKCQCQDCKDQGECFLKEEISSSRKPSKTFEEFLKEYFGLYNRIKKLDKKIFVPIIEEEFSPEEMHKALMAQVDEVRNNDDEKKAEALLKSAIAVEKLGLAVYGAEEDMAGALAKSSWESFKVYLLHKIRLLLAPRIDGIADKLGNKQEAEKMKKKIMAMADILGADKINIKDIENALKKIGMPAEKIKEIMNNANSAYASAQGDVQKYLDNLEKQVRDKYIETYKQIFISNFKEAISNQVVFFQTGLYHHNMFVGNIPNSDKLYKEYPTQIRKIQEQLVNYKKMIEEKNNLFNKSQEISQQIIKSTEELGKKIDKLTVAAEAIDKGAKIAGKETSFEEVIGKAGDYNESINSAVQLAAQTLDIAAKFGESLFGTYKEAEIYLTFYNTYGAWCKLSLGDCGDYIRIPGTNKYLGRGTITRALNSAKKSADAVLKKLKKIVPTAPKQKVLGVSISRQETSFPWCYNFDNNLGIGGIGQEVEALIIVLKKEGLYQGISEDTFDEDVKTAISAFQEKYKEAILSPLGIVSPTGYVGKNTRTKLNQLYGCR